MTTQHTPGPWPTPGPWVLGKFQPRTEIVAADCRRIIAEIQTGDDEGKDNARLIAAAPDMLAALQIMDGLHMPRTELFNGEELPLRVIIDRAIAKATGVQHCPDCGNVCEGGSSLDEWCTCE